MTLEHREAVPELRRQLSIAEATSAFLSYCNSPAEQSTDEQISLVEQLCQKVTFPHKQLPNWSDHLKYIEGNFLNCTDAMVICITANVSMNTKLIGTLERDIKGRETLFNQRKNVGEVAIMPRVTAVSSQYMFFPVLKVSEQAHAATQDMTRCIMKLRAVGSHSSGHAMH